MAKHSDLSEAKRREAVLALLRREETGAKLARRYGISEQTLYRWRDEFITAGAEAITATNGKSGNPYKRRIEELEREIARRDQVIGELTIANKILKKLTGESP